MPATEYDMLRCPSCGSPRVLKFWHPEIQDCGSGNDTVKIIFAMPLIRCMQCEEIFSNHEGEKAQAEALAKYRRILCPTPSETRLKRWCAENEHLTQLASIAKDGVESIIRRWERYRASLLEAGGGIEPPTTGV